MRVLIREDHSAPVVAIFTHVLAGYFDEPDEWVGISHVLEHMFFKGTPTRGPGMIAQATKNAGGYLNASTIYDHTSYHTVVPSSALEEALDIQSDALLNSLIDEEELRKELLVIIQEANRKLDNPAAVARESLFELMFDSHRMRRWRIGREERLKTFTRQDVAAFFERFYRTDSTILVVAGDVDAQRVIGMLEQKYARLRAGAPQRDRGPREAAQQRFRFREMTGDVVQTRIEIGWHTVAPLHEDTPHLDILALVLGQGRASHLYRNVREAGLATGVVAHHYTPTELGVFGISAECEPPDTKACVQRILECVGVVRNGQLRDEDLRRARSVMEARMLRSLETMEGQASFIAEWQALGSWKLGVEYLDTIAQATCADLIRVAQKYLDPLHASALIYRPGDAEPVVLAASDVEPYAR